MTSNIIALCGYAGHGKDTAADLLVEYFGFKKMAFADPLKRMAYAINPIIGYHSYVDEYTGSTWWNKQPKIVTETIRLATIVDKLGWDEAKRLYPEIRTFIQRLATEGIREVLGPQIWVEHLDNRLTLSSAQSFTIPDLRFANEEAYLKSKNAFIIRIVNPRIIDNGVGTAHASESYVAQIKENVTLVNDDTKLSLLRKLAQVVA